MAKNFSQFNEIIDFNNSEVIVGYSLIDNQLQEMRFNLNRLKSYITKSDLGLGNVNNTSDLDKPISTAMQSALNGKANISHVHSADQIANLDTYIQNILSSLSITGDVTVGPNEW